MDNLELGKLYFIINPRIPRKMVFNKNEYKFFGKIFLFSTEIYETKRKESSSNDLTMEEPFMLLENDINLDLLYILQTIEDNIKLGYIKYYGDEAIWAFIDLDSFSSHEYLLYEKI